MIWKRWVSQGGRSQTQAMQRGPEHQTERTMNTLHLIKSRTVRSQALEQARKQMARAFSAMAHTDKTHSNLDRTDLARPLVYRGVSYVSQGDNQVASRGRELRYRGVRYGVY